MSDDISSYELVSERCVSPAAQKKERGGIPKTQKRREWEYGCVCMCWGWGSMEWGAMQAYCWLLFTVSIRECSICDRRLMVTGVQRGQGTLCSPVLNRFQLVNTAAPGILSCLPATWSTKCQHQATLQDEFWLFSPSCFFSFFILFLNFFFYKSCHKNNQLHLHVTF